MTTWWKTLKRSTQFLLIAALFLTVSIVAYAAFQTFVTSEEKSGGITDVPFVEVELTSPVSPALSRQGIRLPDPSQ